MPAASTKRLGELSDEELEKWLASIKLHSVVEKLKAHHVTGEVLAVCGRAEDIAEYGIASGHAKLLFHKVAEAKASGVPLTAISTDTPVVESESGDSCSCKPLGVFTCRISTPAVQILVVSDEEFINEIAGNGKLEEVRAVVKKRPDSLRARNEVSLLHFPPSHQSIILPQLRHPATRLNLVFAIERAHCIVV